MIWVTLIITVGAGLTLLALAVIGGHYAKAKAQLGTPYPELLEDMWRIRAKSADAQALVQAVEGLTHEVHTRNLIARLELAMYFGVYEVELFGASEALANEVDSRLRLFPGAVDVAVQETEDEENDNE